MQQSVGVLAGRRIDPVDVGQPRFPLSNVSLVESRLEQLFQKERLGRLVCAAACGADLIALQVAKRLAINVSIVLPFDAPTFRRLSVADRPGNWGAIFDDIVGALGSGDSLTVLPGRTEDIEAAFEQANTCIIETAVKANFTTKLAFIVWEGEQRGEGDLSWHMMQQAVSRGFELRDVRSI